MKSFLDHTSSYSKTTRLSVTLPPLPSKDLSMGLSTFEARNRTVHATPPAPRPPPLALHLLRRVALGTKFNLCAPQFPQLEAVKVVTAGKVFTNVNHSYSSILPCITGICIIRWKTVHGHLSRFWSGQNACVQGEEQLCLLLQKEGSWERKREDRAQGRPLRIKQNLQKSPDLTLHGFL